jgi:hypothetical protein
MAVAPHVEQEWLINEAMRQAEAVVSEPIAKVEVGANAIIIWAGTKRLTMDYSYTDGATLGSGHWTVVLRAIEETPPEPSTLVSAVVAVLVIAGLFLFMWFGVALKGVVAKFVADVSPSALR